MNFSGFAEDRPPKPVWLPITGDLGFGVCEDVGFQELLRKTCWHFTVRMQQVLSTIKSMLLGRDTLVWWR